MLIDNHKLIRETIVDFVKYAKEMGMQPEEYGKINRVLIDYGKNGIREFVTSPYSFSFETEDRKIIIDYLVYGKDEKGNQCHSFKVIWSNKTGGYGEKEYRYSEFDYNVYGTDSTDKEVDNILEVLKEKNLQSIINAWSYSLYNN